MATSTQNNKFERELEARSRTDMDIWDLSQRTSDAIRVKLQENSPTLLNSIAELKQSVGYDCDAVLRTLLNSTVGGAGPQPLEAEIVQAADQPAKRQAIEQLIAQLFKLRDAQVEAEKVSVLISKLQHMVD